VSDQSQAEALATARINIAELKIQVSNLTQGMVSLQESNQQLAAKVDQVLLALSEARGGWRTLMIVGGAASSVTAALAWVVQHLPKA
jgi:hypothetical protein